MMKKFTLGLALAASTSLFAQVEPAMLQAGEKGSNLRGQDEVEYLFLELEEDYHTFTDGELVTEDLWSSTGSFAPRFEEQEIDLGFDVDLFGFEFSEIDFTEAYAPRFFPGGDYDSQDSMVFFTPMSELLMDRGACISGGSGDPESPVSYTTVEKENGKVFKLQFENAGFENDSIACESFMNYQLWIYEGHGSFEVRFGESFVSSADETYNLWVTIGMYANIAKNDDGEAIVNGDYVFLDGVPGDEEIFMNQYTAGEGPAPEDSIGVKGIPADGTVYRFYIEGTSYSSIEEHNAADFTVAYDAASSAVVVSGQEELGATRLTLIDMNGMVVAKNRLTANANRVNVADLAAGTYMTVLHDASGRILGAKQFAKM